jgi:hypothetical protein
MRGRKKQKSKGKNRLCKMQRNSSQTDTMIMVTAAQVSVLVDKRQQPPMKKLKTSIMTIKGHGRIRRETCF